MPNEILNSLGQLNQFLGQQVQLQYARQQQNIEGNVSSSIANMFLQLPKDATEEDIKKTALQGTQLASTMHVAEKVQPMIQQMYQDSISNLVRNEKRSSDLAFAQAVSKQTGMPMTPGIGGDDMYKLSELARQSEVKEKGLDNSGNAVLNTIVNGQIKSQTILESVEAQKIQQDMKTKATEAIDLYKFGLDKRLKTYENDLRINDPLYQEQVQERQLRIIRDKQLIDKTEREPLEKSTNSRAEAVLNKLKDMGVITIGEIGERGQTNSFSNPREKLQLIMNNPVRYQKLLDDVKGKWTPKEDPYGQAFNAFFGPQGELADIQKQNTKLAVAGTLYGNEDQKPTQPTNTKQSVPTTQTNQPSTTLNELDVRKYYDKAKSYALIHGISNFDLLPKQSQQEILLYIKNNPFTM